MHFVGISRSAGITVDEGGWAPVGDTRGCSHAVPVPLQDVQTFPEDVPPVPWHQMHFVATSLGPPPLAGTTPGALVAGDFAVAHCLPVPLQDVQTFPELRYPEPRHQMHFTATSAAPTQRLATSSRASAPPPME